MTEHPSHTGTLQRAPRATRNPRHAWRALGFAGLAAILTVMGWESFTVPDYFESAISVSEARLLSGRRRGLRVEIRAEDGRVFTLPGALLRGVAHPRDVVAALVSEREATLTHLADADFEGPVPVRAIQVGSIRTTASDGVEYDRGSRSILISGLFITLALALVYLVGWRNPVFGEMLERASARNR